MMDDLRSGVYDFLSLGFRQPAPAQVEVLGGSGTRLSLSDLAGLLPVPLGVQQDQLDRFCLDVERRGAGDVASELLVEYCRLFLGPGAVPCPPYGSVYLDGVLMGASTLDAVRRYRGEGLKADASWREPPDHIAVELGFMARLSAAHCQATDANETMEAERLLRIQGEFVRDHLGRWGPLFAERLSEATSCHLFRFLSGFLPHWLFLDGELLRTAMAEMRVEVECQ
ncbi:MAG: hypothetical protein A2146_00745 [Actinobacteria bacterium RBG_16_67_10]|nr:MAG: hypothetical protein A2146_00745 [Actinobacteria bacterium RBG_16_67_10]